MSPQASAPSRWSMALVEQRGAWSKRRAGGTCRGSAARRFWAFGMPRIDDSVRLLRNRCSPSSGARASRTARGPPPPPCRTSSTALPGTAPLRPVPFRWPFLFPYSLRRRQLGPRPPFAALDAIRTTGEPDVRLAAELLEKGGVAAICGDLGGVRARYDLGSPCSASLAGCRGDDKESCSNAEALSCVGAAPWTRARSSRAAPCTSASTCGARSSRPWRSTRRRASGVRHVDHAERRGHRRSAVAIVGTILFQRAQSNLALAAQQYSAGLINEGLPPREAHRPRLARHGVCHRRRRA